jgi:C-terminal processing protease CtpA/Prc
MARRGARSAQQPGGLLTLAVEISDEFLDQGTIVSTRGACNRPI